MSKHVIHQHSSVADKRPSASSLEYGEIAVNYASGKEAVMLKNTEDAVVTISSDSQNDSKFALKNEVNEFSSQITVIENDITEISAKTGYLISAVTETWFDEHQNTIPDAINEIYIGLSGKISDLEEYDHVGKVYPGSTSGEVFNDYGSNIASGNYSHAEGSRSEAYGSYSHAEGCDCVASGNAAHAEGYGCTSRNVASHAEGFATSAISIYSHAEGDRCVASGNAAHAEGYATSATNIYAHTEGYGCVASSIAAHAEGEYTVASNRGEHACGRYNKSDDSSTTSRQTRFSIGIGTSRTSRKNAIEAKANGDVYIYGVGGFDGGNDADADVLPIGDAIPSIVVTSALPSTLASDTIYFIY